MAALPEPFPEDITEADEVSDKLVEAVPVGQKVVIETQKHKKRLVDFVNQSSKVAIGQWPNTSEKLASLMHCLLYRLQVGKALLSVMDDDEMEEWCTVRKRLVTFDMLSSVKNKIAAFEKLGENFEERYAHEDTSQRIECLICVEAQVVPAIDEETTLALDKDTVEAMKKQMHDHINDYRKHAIAEADGRYEAEVAKLNAIIDSTGREKECTEEFAWALFVALREETMMQITSEGIVGQIRDVGKAHRF